MVPKPKEPSFHTAMDQFGRLFHRRLCLVPEGVDLPGHACVGANRVTGFDGFFNIKKIREFIDSCSLQPDTVALADIWH